MDIKLAFSMHHPVSDTALTQFMYWQGVLEHGQSAVNAEHATVMDVAPSLLDMPVKHTPEAAAFRTKAVAVVAKAICDARCDVSPDGCGAGAIGETHVGNPGGCKQCQSEATIAVLEMFMPGRPVLGQTEAAKVPVDPAEPTHPIEHHEPANPTAPKAPGGDGFPQQTPPPPAPDAQAATAPKRRGRKPSAALTEDVPPPAPTAAEHTLQAAATAGLLPPATGMAPPTAAAPPAPLAPPVTGMAPPASATPLVTGAIPGVLPIDMSKPPAQAETPAVPAAAPPAPNGQGDVTLEDFRRFCSEVQQAKPGLPFNTIRAPTWADGSQKGWTALTAEAVPPGARLQVMHDLQAALL